MVKNPGRPADDDSNTSPGSILLDPNKLKVVLACYRINHEEITRYRDYEWRVTIGIVALMAGIAGMARITPFPGTIGIVLRSFLTFLTIGAAGYGAWHLYYVHSRPVQHWHWRSELILISFQDDTNSGKLHACW